MQSERWRAREAQEVHEMPEAGWLIAWNYGVWRVVDVRPWPQDLWTDEHKRVMEVYGVKSAPVHMFIVPATVDGVDPVARRNKTVSLSVQPYRTRIPRFADEHYSVCVACGSPPPCREVHAAGVAERVMAEMECYTIPGVCPSCSNPVTERQKHIVFMGNVLVPAGPPVVFHLRQGCRWQAVMYERRWVAADPGNRSYSLQCGGLVVSHAGNEYECSAEEACPGPMSEHAGGYVRCDCESCHDSGAFFGARPQPDATRRATPPTDH